MEKKTIIILVVTHLLFFCLGVGSILLCQSGTIDQLAKELDESRIVNIELGKRIESGAATLERLSDENAELRKSIAEKDRLYKQYIDQNREFGKGTQASLQRLDELTRGIKIENESSRNIIEAIRGQKLER